MTELGNRIYSVHFEKDRGTVEGVGVSTLQNDCTQNTAAALWVSADDHFIWVSNRGEGTIAGYSLPNLKRCAAYTMLGKEPRDFCLLENNLIVTACQDAGLTILRNG